MFLSGLLIVFGIPTVWLKPSLNLSESLMPDTNDTLRSKRETQYSDFIHHLIDKHANCADQKLTPLKPFSNFKPFETFVYPYGFSLPEQQFARLPHTSKSTQVKMNPIQQQYTVTNHDSDILKYMASSKELIPIDVGTENYLAIDAKAKGYRLRNNNPTIFSPQYRKSQVIEKYREINKGLLNGIYATITKPIERSERAMKNIIASRDTINTTTSTEKQIGSCPNLLPTTNTSFNLEQNLNILVQELEDITNFNNQTKALHKNSTALNSEDILRMLEKFKALQNSVSNKTTKITADNIENTTTKIIVSKDDLTKITNSPTEISNNNTEPKTTALDMNFRKELKTLRLKNKTVELSSSTTRFKANSTESLDILNANDNNDSAQEMDISESIDNELGISGAPIKIVDDLNPHENLTKLEEINNFDKFATLNLMTETQTSNTQYSPKGSQQNFTLSNEAFNKTTATPNFQFSDKSPLTNSSINITLKNNGSFKTIQIKQQSSESSNSNLKMATRKNKNKGMPNPRAQPSDMTGISKRFIKYLQNPRQSESSELSNESYDEPNISEIYPAKMNKSPLTIYLHRVEEKSQSSNNKPPSRNRRILESDECDNDNDDISTQSHDCDDYADSSESEESQEQNKNLKPGFRELFNYDTNFT